jgi:hypothetical protein
MKKTGNGHERCCDCDDCKRRKTFRHVMGRSMLDRELYREETQILIRAIRAQRFFRPDGSRMMRDDGAMIERRAEGDDGENKD